MPYYVLTGTPGSGKTAILRQLEIDGYRVVEEAATDVIALDHALGQPELSSVPGFVAKIVSLQRRRELLADGGPEGPVVFFDRSPICTLALCRYLGQPAPALLAAEVSRVLAAGVYASTVFFVRNQGYVAPTAARRISFADSLVFEEFHERAYLEHGFRLVEVPAGPLAMRVARISSEVCLPGGPSRARTGG